MRRAAAAIALLLLAPVAVHSLLPGEDERISMLMHDGAFREAAEILRARLSSGEKDPSLLVSLARTREAAGDVRGAIALMRDYAAQRPRDPTGFDTLARLWMLADSPEDALAAMASRVAIEPDEQSVARLAGWLRLHGRFDDEFALLSQMRARGIRLSPADLVRLGESLAARGDFSAALSPLLDADALLPPDQDRGRVLLFDVLVAAGRFEEAADRALHWLDNWQKPWIATRLLKRLPAPAPERDVDRLAAAALRRHPDMRLFIAKTLADRGRQAVAAQILLHWTQDEEKPTVADLGGVVEVARAIGDPTLLWRMLPIILSKRDALPAQAFYVEALAHDSGDAAIVAARDSIPRAILDARPLFAARLALRTGDQRQALRKLMSLRLADLPARDQRAWVALLEAATSPDVALAILLDRRRKGQLPRTLLPSAAELAGRLGQSGEQMTILNELARL